MCDTLVALGDVTADGAVILAKNSDREPNEAQWVTVVQAANHEPGSTVRCTYLEIPQAPHTYAMLLAKPFWMWGAEMGANERRVAIGNEAVWTKAPYSKGLGLTGMDLLRLGLERGETARAALSVITGLLERHGQGGDCGFRHPSYYHNSFIIADPREAWVLETAGPHWAAEQARGVRSISNALTIGDRWDLASPDIVSYAVRRGWCRGQGDFHFARCYSDLVRTRLGHQVERRACTEGYLERARGAVTVETAMQALRDHGPRAGEAYSPAEGILSFTVCAHAGLGPVRASQTTGSLVSHLLPGAATHFVTGTAAPCTSVFKPAWVDALPPEAGPEPTQTYDPAALFWRHERLHRAALRDHVSALRCFGAERDALERRFASEALALMGAPVDERLACASRCFATAEEAERRWTGAVEAMMPAHLPGRLYGRVWAGFNRAARMPG